MKSKEVVIIGYGRWGQALASVLKEKEVTIHPLDVGASEEAWAQAYARTPWTLFATPFKAIDENLRRLKQYRTCGVINASKGIDPDSLLTFSDLSKRLTHLPSATLSGPTFADEVLHRKPTACVIASKDKTIRAYLANLFSTPRFRVYSHPDPKGVEICGAIKNVLAVACGISDGMKLGFNARAALLTRGLIEMEEMTRALGGQRSTVYGLAGVGDLWLTATGDLSRNRQLGLQLAEGIPVETALQSLQGPAEGYNTVRQVYRIGKSKKLNLPICNEIYRICFEEKSAREALEDLMRRPLKSERQKKRKIAPLRSAAKSKRHR